MSDNIDYKEGDHDEFINYLFSQEPKSKGNILFESPPLDPSKHISLHMFEQLLMIFVDGLKYFHGNEEGKVDINKLTTKDIDKIQLYFQSMNYFCKVDIFTTIQDYQFKYPNYFKDQDKIKPECTLQDFFYEIFGTNNRVFRISFTTC